MIYTTKCAGRDALYERMSERKAMIDKQKETNMTNKTTEQKPKITLEHGKTYVTASGERVTVQTKQDSSTPFYKFIGDNGYRYGEHGDFHPMCSSWDAEHIIVSEYKEPQVQPKPLLKLNTETEYLTGAGSIITLQVNELYGSPQRTSRQFLGSNGLYYNDKGGLSLNQSNNENIISEFKEPQTELHCTSDFYDKFISKLNHEQSIVSEYKELQPKLYTAKELVSAMSDSYNNGKSYGRIFSASELQSLTKMQSKVITALEAEILELKETADYLGNCLDLVNRINGLRKQIFNEITTKKKRLVKLVELQQKMKRSK